MIDSDFSAHGVWDRLADVEKALSNFSEKAKQDARYREFSDKTEYVRWILETSLASYIASNELNQTVNELSQVVSHLKNNASNFGHYDQVSNFFASIFSRFPYPRVKRIFRSDANEVIENFRSTVLEIESDFVSRIRTSQKELSDSEERVKKLSEHAAYLNQLFADLEHRIEAQISNYEATVNAQVTEKLSELSREFTKAQNERSAGFQQTENTMQEIISNMRSQAGQIKKDATDRRSAAKKELIIAKGEFETKANEVIDNLNGLYDQAGQTALAAGFAGSATEESGLFRLYSVLASIIFVLVATVTAFMWFSMSKTSGFSFSEMLMRLPVSAVFLVPGLYLASLANKHRKSAVKLRSLSLRIKAFDAYLANAPLEQRQELRSELVREFFEEQPEVAVRQSLFARANTKDTEGLVNLLEKAIEKLGEVKN